MTVMPRLMVVALLAALSTTAMTQTYAQVPEQAATAPTAEVPPTAEEQQMLAAVRRQWKAQGLGEMTPEQEAAMLRKFRLMRGNLATNATMMRMAAASPPAPSSSSQPSPATEPYPTRSVPSSNSVAPAANPPGAAQRPPQPVAGTDANTYTFLTPSDSDPKQDEFACGVRFGFQRTYAGALNMPMGTKGNVSWAGHGTATVSTFNGDGNFQLGVGVNATFSVTVDRSGDACRLTMQKQASEPYKRQALFHWKEPGFTPEDVLTQTARFMYRPSFDSKYSVDATMANFDRLAFDCNQIGQTTTLDLPDDVLSGARRYCVKLPYGHAPFVVKCFPYHDGSKCAVTTDLPASRQDRVLDTRMNADAFRKAIAAIVSD